MAKTFTYKRTSISECDHQHMQPCCGNCDLMDLYISTKERDLFAEGGADAAFKNERGEIIGTDADKQKTFCTITGASVRRDHYCREHVWAKDVWIKPDEETRLC